MPAAPAPMIATSTSPETGNCTGDWANAGAAANAAAPPRNVRRLGFFINR
jgi:hypothetical protein